MYNALLAQGVALSPKPFALGFRVEHPQALIDSIQYGQEYAAGGSHACTPGGLNTSLDTYIMNSRHVHPDLAWLLVLMSAGPIMKMLVVATPVLYLRTLCSCVFSVCMQSSSDHHRHCQYQPWLYCCQVQYAMSRWGMHKVCYQDGPCCFLLFPLCQVLCRKHCKHNIHCACDNIGT